MAPSFEHSERPNTCVRSSFRTPRRVWGRCKSLRVFSCVCDTKCTHFRVANGNTKQFSSVSSNLSRGPCPHKRNSVRVLGGGICVPPYHSVRKPRQIQRLGGVDLLQKPGDHVQWSKKHDSISLLCARLREYPSLKKTPSTDFNHKFSGRFSRSRRLYL